MMKQMSNLFLSQLFDSFVALSIQAIPAAQLARPELLDEDVLVCGDDGDAKRLALDLGQPLVRGRAIDAGPLANAPEQVAWEPIT